MIKIDALGKEVAKVLEEYKETTVENMKQAVDKAAKEAVSQLKSSSPKRTGKYAKGWTSKVDKQTNQWAYSRTIQNKDRYYLTHLLEKGHRKVNGGRVSGRSHIEKAEQDAIETMVKEIKK